MTAASSSTFSLLTLKPPPYRKAPTRMSAWRPCKPPEVQLQVLCDCAADVIHHASCSQASLHLDESAGGALGLLQPCSHCDVHNRGAHHLRPWQLC